MYLIDSIFLYQTIRYPIKLNIFWNNNNNDLYKINNLLRGFSLIQGNNSLLMNVSELTR